MPSFAVTATRSRLNKSSFLTWTPFSGSAWSFDDDLKIAGNITSTVTVQGVTITDGTASLTGGALTGLITPITFGQGGTGLATWTQYLIPYADTTTSIGQIAIGTAGQVLTSGGAGVAPSFQTGVGGGTDTNWETSWTTFDANIVSRGYITSYLDTNYQTAGYSFADYYLASNPSGYITSYLDTNNVTAGWQTNTGAWVTDVNVNSNNIVDVNRIDSAYGNYGIVFCQDGNIFFDFNLEGSPC